jgi:hypothetical protein
MAFHQSAVTLTYFARDYTVPSVGKATMLSLLAASGSAQTSTISIRQRCGRPRP